MSDATRMPRLLVGRGRTLFVRLLLNGLGQAVAATGTVLLVKAAFDRLVRGGASPTPATLAVFAGGLALAAAAFALLRGLERVDAERLGQHHVHDVRMTMFGRLASLAPRALARRGQGAVMLRFVGDLNALRQWVSLGLARLVVGVVFLTLSLSTLVVVNPVLGATVGIVLAAGIASAYVLGRPLRERAREARRRRSRLATNLNERVSAMAVTQIFGQVERERRRTARQSRRLRDAMVRRAQTSGRLLGLTEVVAGSATASALLVGAHEVSAGRASPGVVVASMAIVGLLVAPLRDLNRVQEYWHNSRVSVEHIESFLETPSLVEELPDAPDLVPGPGRVELRDLRVDGVLDGVWAVAEAGSVVAVVGPNGAGKSTLLSVIARLAQPDDGRVSLDGQDLAAHSLASVRRMIGMAGPSLPLLRGTVDRNLRYRWPDAPEEELTRVRRLCEVDEVLAGLPDGVDTRITEGGRGLSAGQHQRLALARALVGRPRLLLLDEADANLDAPARDLLWRIIAEHRGQSTVIVVSHRPEILADADAVWHVEDGAVRVGAPELATRSKVMSR